MFYSAVLGRTSRFLWSTHFTYLDTWHRHRGLEYPSWGPGHCFFLSLTPRPPRRSAPPNSLFVTAFLQGVVTVLLTRRLLCPSASIAFSLHLPPTLGDCRDAVLRHLRCTSFRFAFRTELFLPLDLCASRHSTSYCVFSSPLPSSVCFPHGILLSLRRTSTIIVMCFWWNFNIGASMCSRISPRALTMSISLHVQLYTKFQIALDISDLFRSSSIETPLPFRFEHSSSALDTVCFRNSRTR